MLFPNYSKNKYLSKQTQKYLSLKVLNERILNVLESCSLRETPRIDLTLPTIINQNLKSHQNVQFYISDMIH